MILIPITFVKVSSDILVIPDKFQSCAKIHCEIFQEFIHARQCLGIN